jgi:hypothetical protein
MADLEDIMAVLAGVVTGAIYPNGTGQAPVTGFQASIFPGWPVPKALDDAMAAGRVQVSIYADDAEAVTTRYLPEWREVSRETPTVAVSVAGSTVTLVGTVSAHAIGVAIGPAKIMYAMQRSDTLSTAAAALGAAIQTQTGLTATSSGAQITVNTTLPIAPLVSVPGRMARELTRQMRDFMITVWAPNPNARRMTGAAVTLALSKMLSLNLGDGSVGRMTYRRTRLSDELQTAAVYRRDIIFTVEYPTLEFRDAYEVAAPQLALAAS